MLWNLLLRNCRDAGEHPAFVGDGQRLTWDELRDRATAIACGLHRHGVAQGDAVALLLPNGPCFVSTFLAACRLGAVTVPMNTDMHVEEIRSYLTRSRCRVAVFAPSLADTAARLVADGDLDHVFMGGIGPTPLPRLDSFGGGEAELHAIPSPESGSPLTRLLTSGTTGRPKCVQRTHAQVHFLAESYRSTLGVSRQDRILAAVPMCHGHGFCSGFLASLASGATLHAEPRFLRRPTLELLEAERITVFSSVPFIFSLLSDTAMPRKPDLRSVRLCISGAGALRRETWHKVRDNLGLEVRQSYGSVETGALTINLDADVEGTCESVGTPLHGVEVCVRHEGSAGAEDGEAGHVFARTPAAGELLDAGRAVPRDAEGWTAMHDLGRRDAAGRLFLTGRRTGVVNVAGRKVSTDEVEEVLRRHPAVGEVRVAPCVDCYGEEAVRALVVLKAPCNRRELADHCRLSLAEYKVPRVVDFCDTIPG